MKEANLISILDAFKNLAKDSFDAYLSYYSIKIKPEELKDLGILVNHLKSLSKDVNLFDKYFIGFSIPQIGKEFDLLRIDDETIINIELKKRSTEGKIKDQLARNKYYLSFLKKETFNYTYVSEEKKLYYLDESNSLEEVSLRQLLGKLVSQKVKKLNNINDLFNPSNYLVSPFNSTKEFIRRKYFLTIHQEKIKREVLQQLKLPSYSIISIKGKAGTGKSLLTYDIAKEVLDKRETLIIHCGYLNAGHASLRDNYGWTIISVRDLYLEDYSKFHLVVVDEAQRIRPNQLGFLVRKIAANSNNIIFSYDPLQTLKSGEIKNKIGEKIESYLTVAAFELTSKIRTNKEVSSFIQCLFDKSRPLENYTYSKIELNYFDNYKNAKSFLELLQSEDWKVINYTPSTVSTLPYEQHKLENEYDNAHTVIGQEFDNVVAVIDEFFFYRGNDLSTRNYKTRPFYHPAKMLYQIVSRTRIKLSVVVIKNQEILNRCLEILNKK